MFRALITLLVTTSLFLGCSETSGTSPELKSIQFRAVDADGRDWACGASNLRVGNLSDVRPGDLRFYVHDVQMIGEDGRLIPVGLGPDDAWNAYPGVTLLDFEDASAECGFVIFGKAKTPEMNTHIWAAPVSEGPYRGIQFKLGVPSTVNHSDVALAEAPLNSTGMDHGQEDGRQFLRASFYSDLTGVTGNGDHHLLMLRTVCSNHTAEGGTPPEDAELCTKPNRPVIRLEPEGGFDPDQQEIVVDVGALFAGYSELGRPGAVDLNAEGRVDCFGPLHAGDVGPMSGEARCGTFYPNLGLSYETGRSAGDQSVFRVQ